MENLCLCWETYWVWLDELFGRFFGEKSLKGGKMMIWRIFFKKRNGTIYQVEGGQVNSSINS